MKQIINFAFLIAAALFATNSQATVTSFTNTSSLGTVSAGDIHLTNNTVGVGAFTDFITFDFAGGVGLGAGSTTNNPLAFSFGSPPLTVNIFKIDGFSWGVDTSVDGGVTWGSVFTGGASGASTTFSASAGSLFRGVISGTASGTSGGNYTFAVAAIPEPETWAMLAIGAALTGFQLRRKGKVLEPLAFTA
jgi:hypothetical protein